MIATVLGLLFPPSALSALPPSLDLCDAPPSGLDETILKVGCVELFPDSLSTVLPLPRGGPRPGEASLRPFQRWRE